MSVLLPFAGLIAAALLLFMLSALLFPGDDV